jgi:hypothetical protein
MRSLLQFRSSVLIYLLIYGRPALLPAEAGRCQGFGAVYYSLTLDALDLQHPRLLQR